MTPRAPVPGLAAKLVVALAACVLPGCDLTEVAIAEADDMVVLQGAIVLTLQPAVAVADAPFVVEMAAPLLLHRLFGTKVEAMNGANIRIAGSLGRTIEFVEETRLDLCLARDSLGSQYLKRNAGASCYRPRRSAAAFLPGEALELTVLTADGRELTALSRVPGVFGLQGVALADGRCRLPPDARVKLDWTPADDAWGYLLEAEMEGIGADGADSLYLSRLLNGRQQTEAVFPSEFVAIDEYVDGEESRRLLVSLQDGLPAGATAGVSVSAVDRNWSNWARAGPYHPSGQVRVPSVFGDGTGFFGTAVHRKMRVTTMSDDGGLPQCGPLQPST